MSAKQPLTRHITRVYRRSTAEEREAGASWYPEARAVAVDIAAESGLSLRTVVGIIATTSPLNPWGNNVRLARRIATTGDTSSGYLGRGLRSAQRMLDGADPLDELVAPKIRAFYRAILTAGAEGVVIDRHAYDVAINQRLANDRPGMTPRQYDQIVQLYERASDILSAEFDANLPPSVVQATTWLAWRNRYWAPGAWDFSTETEKEQAA